MALTITLTSSMTQSEMAPHWPAIVKCLERYVTRFAECESVYNILHQCALGRRQLWIIRDEADQVVLTLITEVVQIEATGHKRLVLYELAGTRMRDAVDLLSTVEEWARDNHGVTESEVIGRKGWARLAANAGYIEKAVIWRKRLDHGRINTEQFNADKQPSCVGAARA